MSRSTSVLPRRCSAIAAVVGLSLMMVAGLALAKKSAGYYGVGTPATAEQIAGWDIDVRADGKGLPPGSGSVDDGMALYEAQCASCHGFFGEGMGRYPKLAGGMGTLTDDRPDSTVGSYWPYATTLWDYVNRAMPFFAPQSLSDDEVYAIVAYVLNLNNIVDADFVATQDNLAAIEMPNRDGFIWEDPRPDTDNPRCMKNCRSTVEVADSAADKNVTPRTTGTLDTGQ